jgi:hypothetical protein
MKICYSRSLKLLASDMEFRFSIYTYLRNPNYRKKFWYLNTEGLKSSTNIHTYLRNPNYRKEF